MSWLGCQYVQGQLDVTQPGSVSLESVKESFGCETLKSA